MMDADPSLISFNVILGVLLVDILLSGDNAIVIALVCRSLPKSSQYRVMWLGILGAFLARVLLTSVATMAMQLPLIKLVGGLLLLQISVGLIVDNVQSDKHGEDPHLEPQNNVWAAAKTIILADLVMSLDNVLALSAVTHNNLEMLVLGLVLSIPILMFGSIYISKLLDMFPLLLWLGAAILGGVSGGLLIDDPIFDGAFSSDATLSHFVIPLLAAGAVVQISRIMLANRSAVRGLPKPPSLFSILRGPIVEPPVLGAPVVAGADVREPACAVVATAAATAEPSPRVPPAVVATQVVAAALRVESMVAQRVVSVEPAPAPAPFDGPAVDVLASPAATGVQVPAVAVSQPRDYRVLAALGVFMVLTGGLLYALLNTEEPTIPDRLIAFRCKTPPMVVQYRPVDSHLRFSSGKGFVEARLADGRIAWDDYPLAAQTLALQPPLRVMVSQEDQLLLDGGAFDHTVCAIAH